MKLTNLKIGESGRVIKFNNSIAVIKRLNDMGITLGLNIKLVRWSPTKSGVEIKARDFYLAMRKTDAEKIEVQKL